MSPINAGALAGQVAVVTGGSRGIGRAIVEAYLRAGAKVVFCHFADPQAARAVSELSALGEVRALDADVANEAAVAALFDLAESAFGTPSLVVSNAGILHEAPLRETSLADFSRVIEVNLKGCFLVNREAARRMSTGRIINLASDLASLGREQMVAYCASKGGVISLTRSLARELAPSIQVNAIAPGPVDTDMTSPELMSEAALAKDLDTPMARFASPAEIAELALFLAAAKGTFITGQCYGINGGSAMY